MLIFQKTSISSIWMKDKCATKLLRKLQQTRGSHLLMHSRTGAMLQGSTCTDSQLSDNISIGNECILWTSTPLQLHFCKHMQSTETTFRQLWPNNTDGQYYEAIQNPHAYFDDTSKHHENCSVSNGKGICKGKIGDQCKQHTYTFINSCTFYAQWVTVRINRSKKKKNSQIHISLAKKSCFLKFRLCQKVFF